MAHSPIGRKDQIVEIDYTNHRGERSIRQIIPEHLWWGRTGYHMEPQWLLDAFDVGKDDMRTFAMNQVHAWLPVKNS